MSERIPVEGRPASLQTLYQKMASCFSSLQVSSQPVRVRNEGERVGRQSIPPVIRLDRSLSAYSSNGL